MKPSRCLPAITLLFLLLTAGPASAQKAKPMTGAFDPEQVLVNLEQTVKDRDWRRYGDFLAEDLYETWSFGERERQRELHMTALTELAECYAQQGKYRRAMQLCREILAEDPVREAVSALIALGYKPQDAERMVRNIATDEQTSEELIRLALQAAGRA